MTRPLLLIFTLLAVFSNTAFAEYRVYQYSVRTVLEKLQDNQSYTVVSTLNPVAYQAYHGGADSIEINLVRTWTCAGYTGNGIDLCESPEEQLANLSGEAL